MTKEEARGLAAQAWCTEKTSHIIMEPEIAEAFSEILLKENTRLKAALEVAKKGLVLINKYSDVEQNVYEWEASTLALAEIAKLERGE